MKTNTSRKSQQTPLIAAMVLILVAMVGATGWIIHLVYTEPELQYLKVPTLAWTALVAVFEVSAAAFLIWLVCGKEVAK